jgi:hypothetical protein
MKQLGVTSGRISRWRAPTLPSTRLEPEINGAGRSLEKLARNVLTGAPRIINACATVSHGPIECRGYTEKPELADRVWRFTHDHRDMFCVLDEHSERTLLGWIVGGLPACPPSEIERSIVAESIKRLLDFSPDEALSETRGELRMRPPDRAWSCDIEMLSNDGQRAKLQFFTECAPIPQSPSFVCHADLRNVVLHLRATLPGFECALAEVSAWHSGSVLRFQRPKSAISVGLYVGRRRVAVAHLGAVYGERVVKLIGVGTGIPR